MIINCFKKHINEIMIWTGIVLIVLSLVYMYRWKAYQYTYKLNTNVYTQSISISKKSDNNHTISLEKNTAIPLKNEDDLNVLMKREDYQNGLMIIKIPKLDISAGIMKGTSKEELKLGPGLYEKSPLATKKGGNICIAGHRTTYGAWFKDIDKLNRNDAIILEFKHNKYIYKVKKVFVVDKKDWSITEPAEYSAITLSACHPKGSAEQRIIVRGRLEQIIKSK